MKKKWILLIVVVLLAGTAVTVSAQLRLDMDITVPVYLGFTASSGVSQGVWNSYFIPLPNARLAWQFGDGLIDGGVGLRMFTYIIENIAYPEAFVELNVDRFTFAANVGGYGFLEFGLLSSLLQEAGVGNLSGFHNLIIPDVSAQFRVNDWFRVSAGVLMLAPFGANIGGIFDNFAYFGYINAKFVVKF
ncbi:MAG TPA: hypothetical protein VHE79_02415 [Spirochaetia bacterium]